MILPPRGEAGPGTGVAWMSPMGGGGGGAKSPRVEAMGRAAALPPLGSHAAVAQPSRVCARNARTGRNAHWQCEVRHPKDATGAKQGIVKEDCPR